MESKYRQEKIILAIALCFIFCGCSKPNPIADKQSLPTDIRNGDVICRLGNGFFSNQFKKCSVKEKIYSHAGIIRLSADSIFVIHAEASELTGIGSVKKENISDFLENIKIWGVYRLSAEDSTRDKIASKAEEYYLKNTPFDLDFDAENDSKVYCTELIALSVNYAFGDSIIKPTFMVGDKKIYGIDDVYLLPNMETVKKVTN